MKKLLFFSLALLLMGANVFAEDNVQYVHPDDAAYKIDGRFYYEIVDTTVNYKLTDVVGTGLTLQRRSGEGFSDIVPSDILRGHQFDGKEVGFRFSKIIPSDGFPGFQNISYWYYDPDINDWQRDSEIRKSELQQETSKQLTVMLIIDCSSSLGSSLSEVQAASKIFLDKIAESSPNGNVHVGIIAFSSIPDTKMYRISPLTKYSLKSMKEFIDSLRIKNGTALFYAWDQAIQATEAYLKNGKFERSYFVTFTDGIDQTSQDLKHRPKPIVSADDYYHYIIEDAKGRIPNYESDVVFVRGSDIDNDLQLEKFEKKLKQLAVPDDDEHYTRLAEIEQLQDKFDDIASRLTESWKELVCFVAPARHGKVCWTFGAEEKVKAKPAPVVKKKPTVKKRNYCGMTFGLGVDMWFNSANGDTSTGLPISVGFDYAWRLSDKFGLGLYTVIGAGPVIGNYSRYIPGYGGYSSVIDTYFMLKMQVGLLMLMGDLDKKPFILGVTPLTGFSLSPSSYEFSLPLEVRFGRLLGQKFSLCGYGKVGVSPRISFEAGLLFGLRF